MGAVLREQALVLDRRDATPVERRGIELELPRRGVEQEEALRDVVPLLARGAGLVGQEQLLRGLRKRGEVVDGEDGLDAGKGAARLGVTREAHADPSG
jgi:hypothetical protein